MLELKIIGNSRPSGLCGSGIVEAVSEIIRVGLVENTGRLREKLAGEYGENTPVNLLSQDKGKKRVILCPGQDDHPEIAITQSDIRQVQLAKGAILSGFYALLEHKLYTSQSMSRFCF